MIRPAAVLLAGCAVACGNDIRLGTAIDALAIDVPIDGNGNPFAPGPYAAQFLDPAVASCSGTLGGKESDFMTLTAAGVGFVGGTVTFATPTATTLAITGTPISSGWGQSEVDLLANQVDAPPNLWTAQTTATATAGPDSTTRAVNLLAADDTTASSPSGIQGEAGAAYTTTDTNGTCSVTFGALFTKQ